MDFIFKTEYLASAHVHQEPDCILLILILRLIQENGKFVKNSFNFYQIKTKIKS